MNADSIKRFSSNCPICHHPTALRPHKLLTGLLTCEYCRRRLVVSWSGHYVRDPFALKSLSNGRQLRRASHPLARVGRDVLASPRSRVIVVLGTALLIGLALVTQQQQWFNSESSPRSTLLR
ncbi:MAG: hypothetical protein ACKO24_02965 [Leptolyngbyaceae cyanobacterium]